MFPNPGQSFSNGCSQPGYDTSTHCIHSFDRMSIQLKSNRRNLRQANSHYKVKCVNETRDDTSSHPDGSAMPPTHNGPSLFSIRPAVYAPESFILALLNLRLPASMATITSLRLRRGAFKRPHLVALQELPLAFLPPVIFSKYFEQLHVPFRLSCTSDPSRDVFSSFYAF